MNLPVGEPLEHPAAMRASHTLTPVIPAHTRVLQDSSIPGHRHTMTPELPADLQMPGDLPAPGG